MPDFTGYAQVGLREDLDHLLSEYGLSDADVAGTVMVWTPPGTDVGGRSWPPEYLIREELMRSHDPFPCAGDREAREFCFSIASEIVLVAGVSLQEAIDRINQHWSTPVPGRAAPRIWITCGSMVYHETAEYWARRILEQTSQVHSPDIPASRRQTKQTD